MSRDATGSLKFLQPRVKLETSTLEVTIGFLETQCRQVRMFDLITAIERNHCIYRLKFNLQSLLVVLMGGLQFGGGGLCKSTVRA